MVIQMVLVKNGEIVDEFKVDDRREWNPHVPSGNQLAWETLKNRDIARDDQVKDYITKCDLAGQLSEKFLENRTGEGERLLAEAWDNVFSLGVKFCSREEFELGDNTEVQCACDKGACPHY